MRFGFFAAWASAAVVLAQTGAFIVPSPRVPRTPPEQPLPFSHKLHTAQGLRCAQCHPIPGNGDFATLPATSVCMGCHQSVRKDSPQITKLAGFHRENQLIPWRPVYRIPEWISFNHRKHLAAGQVSCETCHGPVAQRDALARERDISMQACMDCHRARNASNECIVCHDPR